MQHFLDAIRTHTDWVLFLLIWLVVLLIYILRQKHLLEKEVARRKTAEDAELSRQSKGRLTSLDAIVVAQSAEMSDGPPSTYEHVASFAPPQIPRSVSLAPPYSAEQSYPSPPPSAASSTGSSVEHQAALLTQYTSGDGGGVEEMERMLERDPNNLQLLDWLAFMYYSNNEVTKAIQTYTRIIDIEPNNASQHYYLGNCFLKNNDRDRALLEWNTVIALKPNSKYARKAQERIAKLGSAS